MQPPEQHHVARDTWRHPHETLTFFGIKPTMTLAELMPEGGWYTEMLAPYLRQDGKLISAGLISKTLMESNPAVYNKVVRGAFNPPKAFYNFASPNSVDMVLTFRDVHNFVDLGDDKVNDMFKALYTSLKPGGVLGVTDHRLPESMPQDATASSGASGRRSPSHCFGSKPPVVPVRDCFRSAPAVLLRRTEIGHKRPFAHQLQPTLPQTLKERPLDLLRRTTERLTLISRRLA